MKFDERLNEIYFNTVIQHDLLEEGVLDNIKKWATIAAVSIPVAIGALKMGGALSDVLHKNPNDFSEQDLEEIVGQLRQMPTLSTNELPDLNNTPLPPRPGEVTTTPVQPEQPQQIEDRNATFQQYRDRIAQEEGVRDEVYRDTSGNLTIGIGHLIEPGDRRLFDTMFGRRVNYDDLIGGRATLTDDQIDALFEHDLAERMDSARTHITNFNNYPDYVQVAIVDGFFRGDLSGSPRTIGLINGERWNQVADEYRNNNEYRASRARGAGHGVWQRMDRNAAAFDEYAEELEEQQNNSVTP